MAGSYTRYPQSAVLIRITLIVRWEFEMASNKHRYYYSCSRYSSSSSLMKYHSMKISVDDCGKIQNCTSHYDRGRQGAERVVLSLRHCLGRQMMIMIDRLARGRNPSHLCRSKTRGKLVLLSSSSHRLSSSSSTSLLSYPVLPPLHLVPAGVNSKSERKPSIACNLLHYSDSHSHRRKPRAQKCQRVSSKGRSYSRASCLLPSGF